MERNLVKLQKKEISYAAATAAGTKTDTFDLDEDFDRVTGIYIHEISDGDLGDEYEVGLSDSRGSIIDVTNKTVFQASNAVAPDGKFFSLNFKIDRGMGLKILTKFDSVLASDALNFIVVLRLERDAKPSN